jgi:MATE family multidrug resistance protein
LNILLDYGFIVGWGWNSAGAGWAITISQWVMAGLGLGLIGRSVIWRDLKAIASQIWDRSAMQQTLALNGNIFVRTLAFLSTFSVFTSLSAVLGEVQFAENALLLQVFSLAVYLIDGLAFATESLIGILHGQQQRSGLRFVMQLSGVASLGFGLGFALLFLLVPQPLFALLTNHQEVLNSIDRSVIWLIPVLGFGSLAFMLDGYFLGLAEGPTLRNVAILSSLIGFAPIALLAWQLQNNDLLWLALAVFMALRVLFLGIQVPRTLQK